MFNSRALIIAFGIFACEHVLVVVLLHLDINNNQHSAECWRNCEFLLARCEAQQEASTSIESELAMIWKNPTQIAL
jgi:hypothetical protein